MNAKTIKSLFAVIASLAVVNVMAMTMSERVTAAVKDPEKIAEVMPATEQDKAKFKAALLEAVECLPASPEEKKQKKQKIQNKLQELQTEKVFIFSASSPETFTGKQSLDLTTAITNLVELEEIDMGYGLDRKPRTMDKTKKYYPIWKRGEKIPDGSHEPGGYSCQTL